MKSLLQMTQCFTITLDEKRVAKAIQVDGYDKLCSALHALELHPRTPVLVVVGGASKLNDDDFSRLQLLFEQVLAPLAESLNMTVIDGGTDAGVMKLIGHARQDINGTFPLVGVVPIELANFPENPYDLAPDSATLEANHTHFLFVPGAAWGDESPWIAKVASVLAEEEPSIAILANGGEISWTDAQQNVEANRPVIVVEGSGRTADILAQALQGQIIDDRAQGLLDSKLLQSIEMANDFQDISQTLRQIIDES